MCLSRCEFVPVSVWVGVVLRGGLRRERLFQCVYKRETESVCDFVCLSVYGSWLSVCLGGV